MRPARRVAVASSSAIAVNRVPGLRESVRGERSTIDNTVYYGALGAASLV